MDQMIRLNIPSPFVYCNGLENGFLYMILNKLKGINGTLASSDQKVKIWYRLGTYARRFHQIRSIEIQDKDKLSFHQNWKDQLHYNIAQLHPKDSLLVNCVFSKDEHHAIKKSLQSLDGKQFEFGLIHKDLSLRNVIVNGEEVYLLDWGMGEISIVPHMEIGSVIAEGEIKPAEFNAFIQGLGLTVQNFAEIGKDIHKLNLLDRLDKYRWAEDHAIDTMGEYVDKLKFAFERVKEFSNKT